MKKNRFELCLFSIDPILVHAAALAGIDTIIVDWESKGKNERQKGFNTQINSQGLEDLKQVRDATEARVICRINAVFDETECEVERAILGGADEILVPMVRTTKEVEDVLKLVDGRIGVGILIETNAAVEISRELTQLPLSRIYVGLNDLAIENDDHNIFTPLVNETLDKLRKDVTLLFGFGGLTLPDLGAPIACRLLIGELMRLKCQFTFLRRSFLAHVKGKNLSFEVGRLREALEVAEERSPEQIFEDREQLKEGILALNLCGQHLI